MSPNSSLRVWPPSLLSTQWREDQDSCSWVRDPRILLRDLSQRSWRLKSSSRVVTAGLLLSLRSLRPQPEAVVWLEGGRATGNKDLGLFALGTIQHIAKYGLWSWRCPWPLSAEWVSLSPSFWIFICIRKTHSQTENRKHWRSERHSVVSDSLRPYGM